MSKVFVSESMSKVVVLFLCCFCSCSFAQNSSSCPAYTSFANKYTACNALPALNSYLHWNYYKLNNSIDIAYRHTGITPSNWVVWSINPSATGMIGSQCLVAMFNSTTNSPRVYTSSVSGYNTHMQEGPLSLFSVPSMRAEYSSNGQMIIYATIVLPTGRTSFQQVWQHGIVSRSGFPMAHPMTQDHLTSFSNIDFATGETVNTGRSSGSSSRQNMKIGHGVVNMVSWGIMMPLGAMAARYLKVFLPGNPTWFYIHVACQASAYVVGMAGFGSGLYFHYFSSGRRHMSSHMKMGISLAVLGTLQALAILLRPKPDSKYRTYWNVYHHSIGWTVIILSITNVFVGLNILDTHKKWTIAYAVVIIAIIAVAACFEAFSWYLVLLNRKKESSSKQPANGSSHLVNAEDAV